MFFYVKATTTAQFACVLLCGGYFSFYSYLFLGPKTATEEESDESSSFGDLALMSTN